MELRRSKTIQYVAAITLCVFTGQLTACDGTVDTGAGAPPPATGEQSALRMHYNMASQGTSYRVDLEATKDGALSGVRTVTAPDGKVTSEPFQIDRADFEQPFTISTDGLDQMSSAEIGGLRIERSETVGTKTVYHLVDASGAPATLEVEGDSTYAFPILAAVLIAGIGVVALIAACGIVTYWSIRSCARNNRCWSYNILPIACWGRCQNC